MILWRAAVLVALLSLHLPAETKVPPIWPQILGIFPHGGLQGSEVTVTIKGRNLQDARSIVFKSPKLTATIVQSNPYEVKAVVRVAADAEPGRHDLRFQAAHGSAIGYFHVGTHPERTEKEPNDELEKADPLPFPTLMNGVIKKADYDFFRFEANFGQVIVFDVLASRIGGFLDASISVLNGKGEELAYSDDYYGFKDPHLVWKAPSKGTYYLRVTGSSEDGCDTCDYRLIAGELPHAYLAMPGGGKRGSSVEFSLKGVNFGSIRKITLGDALAEADVLSATPNDVRARVTIPPTVEPGVYRLHADGATVPVPFVVSTYDEVTVSDGSARSRRDPKPVSLPVVANGIFDKPRAADHFVFRVDRPMTVVLETLAMQLDFLTDPLVLVHDEAGNRIAYQDDPTTNTGKEPANMDTHLVVKLPKAGRYIATVRDAQFRGDPSFFYRLTIKEAEPDFSIRMIGTDDTLYRGRTNKLLVRVRRLEGWNAPVEVWAENLPPGVMAQPVVAATKNTPYTGTCGETHYLDGTNVELQFVVAKDAPLSLGHIRIRGKGVYEGRNITRSGRSRYFRSRINHIGDAEEDDLRVTVADAPGAVLQAPQQVTLEKDGTASFTAVVTRLDDGSNDPMQLTLESPADGLTMPAVEVPAASTRANVKLRAGTSASGEFVLVGRVNGAVIGKSHPITVRSKT